MSNPGVIPLITDSIWENEGGTAVLKTFMNNLDIRRTTTFSSSGNRVHGDLSNSTIANRLLFQTYIPNNYTSFGLIPSGIHDTSVFSVFNSSTPDEASNGTLSIDSSSVTLQSGKSGSASYLPLVFNTGGSERIKIDTNGNVGINETTPGAILDVNGDIRLQDISIPVDTVNKL